MAKAKTKSATVLKVLGVVFATLILIVCFCLCAWWYYIFWLGPEVQISNTYNIGLQEATDGTTQNVIEVKYFKNSNGSGLEALEIKLNGFSDETQTLFTSQGMQFVESTAGAGLAWEFNQDMTIERQLLSVDYSNIFSWRKLYNAFGRFEPTSQYYNYSSMNNFETPAGSADPITENSFFTIQIGDDLFMMKFKDDNYNLEDDKPYQIIENAGVESYLLYSFLETNYLYTCYDEQWLGQVIYDLVKPMSAGTNSVSYFTFGDYFKFYKYDAESGQYVDTEPAETELIKVNMRTNFSIKFEVVADGLYRASQSMFKAVVGSPNYNANANFDSEDYYTGRPLLILNEYNFDYILLEENFYAATLDDSFINEYLDDKKDLVLRIEINLDNLKAKDINFVGFVDDWNAEGFTIHEAYTIATINGEQVKEVIAC